jgi:hypothetical protein
VGVHPDWCFSSHLLEAFTPTEPSRWGTAMALYMISFITYGATIAFYMAVFPRLARNTPHARQLRGRYERGEISAEEYEVEEGLEKNRICNTTTVRPWLMFFFHYRLICRLKTLSYLGYTLTLCLNLILLLPLKENPMVEIYVLVLSGRFCFKRALWLLTLSLNRVNSYWVLVGVWWCKPIEMILDGEANPLFSHLPTSTPWTPDTTGFLVPDHRLEAGRSSHLDDASGVHSSSLQIWTTTKQYKKLPYTFTYLFSFFLLADVRYTG